MSQADRESWHDVVRPLTSLEWLLDRNTPPDSLIYIYETTHLKLILMASTFHSIGVFKDAILGTLFCIIGGMLPKLKPRKADLSGKTAIVTGSSSGIGYGFALQIAEMGATVYLACRNEKKAADARNRILEECINAKVEILSLVSSAFIFITTLR